ncbi:MAG: hypothetical protein ACR2MO_01050 [Acidimicrobiales bacterium]
MVTLDRAVAAAVQAQLLEQAGRPDEAIAEFRAAAAGTTDAPGRDHLTTRAARLTTGTGATSHPGGR